MIPVNGKMYKRLVDVANDYKLEYYTLAQKVHRGDTPENAVNKLVYKRKQLHVNGVDFKSLKDIGEKYNIHPSTIRKQAKENNQTIEQAVNTIIKKRNSIIYVNEEPFRTLTEVANKYQLNAASLSARLQRKSETVEEAVNNMVKNRRHYVNGKYYNTKKEVAKCYGIDYSHLVKVANGNNINLERAVNMILTNKRHKLCV